MNDVLYDIGVWLGSGSINIFGRPFAGKDTQGKIIAELFDGILVSSGDILRHDHGNEKVQQIMAAGGNIPSDLFSEIVIPYLSKPELAGQPLILSEVGRISGEDDVVMRATETSDHPTKAVVYLNLSEEDVWERFDTSQKDQDRGERSDDQASTLTERLKNYREQILPVIERYREMGLLVEVDGSLSKEEVTKAILNGLHTKAIS